MGTISTEELTDKCLFVNNCGLQILNNVESHLKMYSWFTYHILYITEGIGYVTIDGKRIKTFAGDLIFFLPGQYREYDFYRNVQSKSYYVFFNGDDCENIARSLKLDTRNIYSIGIDRSLSKLFDNLIDEFNSKNRHYEYMCHSHMLAIMTAIARKVSEAPHEQSEARKRINEVCKYVYENYSKITSISELAQLCHLSESRFSHLFSETMKISPKNYLLRARIEAAKEMLANTDYSIGQISESVGLHDQNYFSRTFKRLTSITPTEYRKSFLRSTRENKK